MTWGAFQRFGLELEYMIVDRDTLRVEPIADRVLDGNELPSGRLAWSNELVAHVIELKNREPSPELGELGQDFAGEVRQMNARLEPLGARLMPSAMHPWMDPRSETRLWPRGNAAIYRAYDRIFDCRAHGWANLQSVHINLPFADDREFARLHAAIRLALPIVPAIAASSPFAEGRAAGPLDFRLEAYWHNAAAVPSMTGQMVPEPASSRAQYEQQLLRPLYQALAVHDPEGVLRHEWANARGAIARFERNAIEIRVVDIQECPAADIAVAAAIIDLVWLLYQELPKQPLPTDELARVLSACIADADRALIDSPAYLAALRGGQAPCEAAELWRRLADRLRDGPHRGLWQSGLEFILRRGPLARRLMQAVGARPSRAGLERLYAELCDCLEENRWFDPSH